ncbi:hypothetical protein TWF506_009728 [Arthrobotrys conoides]|uniref:Uncharacterized protein n=1 Tax=Arthrobotrys conoides TaxID=74498 RepID=A0AAN8RST8_9PEZI
MATVAESCISIFDSDLEWPLPPSVIIEEALQDNPFMAAAAGKTFTQELPSTWKRIPRIATTAFTVPTSAVTTLDFHSASDFRHDRFSRSGTPGVKPASSTTSLDHSYKDISSAPRFFPKAQSESHILENYNTRESTIQHSSNRRPASQPQLPEGFMSHQVSSSPEAYILKHNDTDSKVLLTPDGEIKPFYAAQKQAYFGPKRPFPPDTIYYDPRSGFPVHIKSYSQPYQQNTLPLFNPVEGTTGRMSLFKDEIIPTFDMKYYPDLLHLPSRPSDVLVYFNSICAAAALSPNRKAWITDNIRETEVRFCGLDDAVFQMCEAYSGKPLRGPNDVETGKDSAGGNNSKAVPNNSLFFDWALELQECRIHLERLNKLAYVPAMNKCKVDVVWKALVYFRDNWANNIFSRCDYELWEASTEEVKWMKEYHAFNREMQRLIQGVEDDLVEIGKLENIVTAFRGAVWKAEAKFQKLRDAFGFTMAMGEGILTRRWVPLEF